MSKASEKLKQDRSKIIQAIAGAVSPPQTRTLPNKSRLKLALVIGLICTMLPIQAATLFFSFILIITFITFIKTTHQSKHFTATIIAMSIVSILSGYGLTSMVRISVAGKG